MAEQISPTRSNLLARRAQRKLAVQGVDLLKRKRDALIAEFFALVRESLAAREGLTRTSKDAYFSLFLAKSFDSPEAVESVALARQLGMDVDVSIESVYGVKVAKVTAPELNASLPFSPIGVGASTLEAARQFQGVVQSLIQVAATENKLRRIGEEIKKTSRRVNALEQIVVPRISAEIKEISSVLDQRALEEVTTLKRIKDNLEMDESQSQAAEHVTAGLQAPRTRA
jgi:V/A-type H+-transporting ATPase subunit D